MRDVIIIGAGAGGPVVAKELAARGLDVLLLEAGARFAEPEFEWTRLENDASNPVTGYFRFGPADRSKPPWVREFAQSSLLFQTSGVGGTTLVYAANCPRAMPGVFVDYQGADRNAYDRNHLFPLGYRDLIPYYEWVERTLPVETAPMGTKEEVFFRGASLLGLPVQTTKDITQDAFRPQENAILQPCGNAGRTSDPSKLVYPEAQGCTFCGSCGQGCVNPHAAPRNLKAKRSTDNSYIPMALTADRWASGRTLTLISDAFAIRVDAEQIGQQSVARSVTWRFGATGEIFTEDARAIVMAGGAVETPRLWLNSGLPNPNDWVGRGLTYHVMDVVVGIMPFYVGTSKGQVSAARADFPGRGMFEQYGEQPAALADEISASDATIAGAYRYGLEVGSYGADGVGRLVGTDLKAALSRIDSILRITIIADDDVEAGNRVKLSSTMPPDEHGRVPRVEIHHHSWSARTMANREFLAEKAIGLVRLAGASTVYRMNWMPAGIHLHSTMRMGLSPEDSVLDENCESRWVKRLFIADGSALANSLGGPNPALTIQALATRTAEKIFTLYFGGEPWVTKELPICSTDPRVTNASSEPGRSCQECHGSNKP
jgi:choline dehydrogenase-like flavoprotein